MKPKHCCTLLLTLMLVTAGCTPPAPQTPAGGTVEAAPSSTAYLPVSLPRQSDTPVPTATEAPTATITPPPEIFFTPTPGATAVGGTGRAILGLAQRTHHDQVYSSLGVFALDLTNGVAAPLTSPEFNLQAVSADGRQMLIFRGNELYTARSDGLGAALLSDQFYGLSFFAALWLPGSRTIAAILTHGGTRAIWLLDEGSQWQQVATPGLLPMEIHPFFDDTRLYFVTGECADAGECVHEKWYYVTTDGLTIQELPPEVTHPIFSSDGKVMAYGGTRLHARHMDGVKEPVRALNMMYMDGGYIEPPYARGGFPADYAFSPTDNRLLVLAQERSLYHGETEGNYLILGSAPEYWRTDEVTIIPGLWGHLAWSPDGQRALLSSTELLADGIFRIDLRVCDLATGAVTTWDGRANLTSQAFIFITHLVWQPPTW